jgi:hypothetical protein
MHLLQAAGYLIILRHPILVSSKETLSYSDVSTVLLEETLADHDALIGQVTVYTFTSINTVRGEMNV